LQDFVNDICVVLLRLRPIENCKNIPIKEKLAYDCATISGMVRSMFNILSLEGTMRFSKAIAAPILSLALLALPCASFSQNQAMGTEADSAAIKKTCADFSQSFTRHDGHAVAMTFAEDADFTNMRGIHSGGRKDIEKWFTGLFTGNLKDSVRTDTVRSIRYFSPDLAAVDADTVITGTKAADGSVTPPRKGLMVVVMVKENGSWFIGTFHESEYPATRPGPAGDPAR
jgi:uncharacterized protein (TIGR02246 family)